MSEKKTVKITAAGSYELPAPKGKTTVAVNIIDIPGEQVVATFEV